MDNPTKCSQINNKLTFTRSNPEDTVETGLALSVAQVNPTPPTAYHIQNCYRDSTLAVGQFFILDNASNPQFTTPPPMNIPCRWSIVTNTTFTVGVSVELTLVDTSNNEAKVTLLTNSSTIVYTPLAIYKHCNDIRITSNHNMLSSDVIYGQPDFALSANNIRTVLSANYKFNAIFMCCNAADGTPRTARLVGLPQIYSGTATSYRMYKWPSSNSLTTTASPVYSVMYVDSATSTAPGFKRRVQTNIDGQIELKPGEACAWWRSASTNTLAVVTAHWSYYNSTS